MSQTKEEIREWLESITLWPNAESYELDTLQPTPVLAKREAALKELYPDWFFEGESGANILSIGTGKGYFERKYWGAFNKIYSIEPSEKTQLSFRYYPIPNLEHMGDSLFNVSPRLLSTPKYGSMGACIHYLFAEFHGWEFMYKLAMMISDTLVVDAGVFDADTPQGNRLFESWERKGVHQRYRLNQFSYRNFREKIEGLWEVVSEWETPWISDGRRNLVLKRVLPPMIQKSKLGEMEPVVQRKNWGVYRTKEGYYKESPHMTPLLMHDTASKVMGWENMVRWRVYDGHRFSGFVTRDYGNEDPVVASTSEKLHLSLMSWLLPLGMLPGDLAKQNIRIRDGGPVWIDVDIFGLNELDAEKALWIATNLYKEYETIPDYVRGVNKYSGATANRIAPPQQSIQGLKDEEERQELIKSIRRTVQTVLPQDVSVLVASKGDDDLLDLQGRHAMHFPQSEEGAYAGYYPGDSEEATKHLEELKARGGDYLLFPRPALWWLEHYEDFSRHLNDRYPLIWNGPDCKIYELSPKE